MTIPITLKSVTRDQLTRPPRPKGWLVIFHVHRGEDATSFDFPAFVSEAIDEVDAVRVARSALAKTFQYIAEERKGWQMTPEEVKAIQKPPSATPS